MNREPYYLINYSKRDKHKLKMYVFDVSGLIWKLNKKLHIDDNISAHNSKKEKLNIKHVLVLCFSSNMETC